MNQISDFPQYFEMPETDAEKVAWMMWFSFPPYPYVFQDYEDIAEGIGQRAYNLYRTEITHQEDMRWRRLVDNIEYPKQVRRANIQFACLTILGVVTFCLWVLDI